MKKRALAILMAALTASTMFAVPTFAADYSGEDPQLREKHQNPYHLGRR